MVANVVFIVACGQDAIDGINLPTNPLDPRRELLFFPVDVAHKVLIIS
jgi:hypothetical protein